MQEWKIKKTWQEYYPAKEHIPTSIDAVLSSTVCMQKHFEIAVAKKKLNKKKLWKARLRNKFIYFSIVRRIAYSILLILKFLSTFSIYQPFLHTPLHGIFARMKLAPSVRITPSTTMCSTSLPPSSSAYSLRNVRTTSSNIATGKSLHPSLPHVKESYNLLTLVI